MGRPKGSKNKRSVGIPADLQAQLGHRDPWDVLGEMFSMPLKQMQKAVRSQAGARAMKLRMDAAVAALPYVRSKLPAKVEIDADELPYLKIVTNQNSMELQRLKPITIDAVGSESVGLLTKPLKEKD